MIVFGSKWVHEHAVAAAKSTDEAIREPPVMLLWLLDETATVEMKDVQTVPAAVGMQGVTGMPLNLMAGDTAMAPHRPWRLAAGGALMRTQAATHSRLGGVERLLALQPCRRDEGPGADRHHMTSFVCLTLRHSRRRTLSLCASSTERSYPALPGLNACTGFKEACNMDYRSLSGLC